MSKTKAKQRMAEWVGIWRATDNIYMQILKQWDFSLNSFIIFEAIQHYPEGVEPASLAESLGMFRQTISVVLNDLENRALIQKESHQTDKRRKLIKLTPEGAILLTEIINRTDEIEDKILSEMSPKEQKQLVKLSRTFYDCLLEASEIKKE